MLISFSSKVSESGDMTSSSNDVPRVEVDTVVIVETRSGFDLFRPKPTFRVERVEMGMIQFFENYLSS